MGCELAQRALLLPGMPCPAQPGCRWRARRSHPGAPGATIAGGNHLPFRGCPARRPDRLAAPDGTHAPGGTSPRRCRTCRHHPIRSCRRPGVLRRGHPHQAAWLMRHVELTRDIAAPAEAVWSLLTDTSLWPRWGPTVSDVEIADRVLGPASRGRVRTVVGVWLPFEVTSFEPGRSWTWRVAGVPATSHRIEPLAAGRTRLVFGVPWPAAIYAAVLAIGMRNIERLLESSRSATP